MKYSPKESCIKMMNRLFWFPILLITLALTSCSSTPDPPETSTQDIYSADEQIFVGDSIEMSYDPNVIMKRAESFFDKESYAEAIVEYKHFLDLHRNHILAPYAQYKIGVVVCYSLRGICSSRIIELIFLSARECFILDFCHGSVVC